MDWNSTTAAPASRSGPTAAAREKRTRSSGALRCVTLLSFAECGTRSTACKTSELPGNSNSCQRRCCSVTSPSSEARHDYGVPEIERRFSLTSILQGRQLTECAPLAGSKCIAKCRCKTLAKRAQKCRHVDYRQAWEKPWESGGVFMLTSARRLALWNSGHAWPAGRATLLSLY